MIKIYVRITKDDDNNKCCNLYEATKEEEESLESYNVIFCITKWTLSLTQPHKTGL